MSSFVAARLSASALLARPAKALPAVQRRQALISLVLATRGFGSAAGAQQTSQTCANAMCAAATAAAVLAVGKAKCCMPAALACSLPRLLVFGWRV